jgi:uncharacterized damage-inducible protein DinB
MAALEGVSDEAFDQVPDRHNGFPWMNGSIRDIVYHVAGDKLVQINHAFGDGTMNWENVPVDKHRDLIDQLRTSQESLIEAIKATQDFKKRVTSWGGRQLTANDFFLMLIEHDIYHAGQIRYIRNLVE